MDALFPDQPEALANTRPHRRPLPPRSRYGLQDLPLFPTPHGMDTGAYLRRCCLAGLRELRPDRRRTKSAPSSTTSWRSSSRPGWPTTSSSSGTSCASPTAQGIRCQGRGSAANSLVAYLLGITPIDPLAPRPGLRALPLRRARRWCPTSTSTSTPTGARRSSSTSTNATAPTTRRWPAPSSPSARAAPCATWARRWGSPPTSWPRRRTRAR